MTFNEARIKEGNLRNDTINDSRLINNVCHKVIDLQAVPIGENNYQVVVHLSGSPLLISSMCVDEFLQLDRC